MALCLPQKSDVPQNNPLPESFQYCLDTSSDSKGLCGFPITLCLAGFASMMKRRSQVEKVTSFFKTGSSNQAYLEMVELTEKVARYIIGAVLHWEQNLLNVLQTVSKDIWPAEQCLKRKRRICLDLGHKSGAELQKNAAVQLYRSKSSHDFHVHWRCGLLTVINHCILLAFITLQSASVSIFGCAWNHQTGHIHMQ